MKDKSIAKGTFCCAVIQQDVPTLNGNIYSKECLEKMVQQAKGLAVKDQCFAAAGDASSYPWMSQIAGKVMDCHLKDGKIYADIELLDTPSGRSLSQRLCGFEAIPLCKGKVGEDGRVDPASLSLSVFYLDPKPAEPGK